MVENSTNEQREAAKFLYRLAEEGNIREIQQRFADGFVNASSRDSDGNTVLHHFMELFAHAHSDDEAMSSQCLAAALAEFKNEGLDFSVQNNAGKSPLDLVQHIKRNPTTQTSYEEALRPHRVVRATPAVRDVVAQGRAAGAPDTTIGL